MKLIDLLSIQNEHENALVISADAVDLAIYDGKNGIDSMYNDCAVLQISTDIINGRMVIVYVIDFIADDADASDSSDSLRNGEKEMENKIEKAIADTMEFVQMMMDDAPNASQFFMDADTLIFDYINKRYGRKFDDDTIKEMHYECCDILNEMFEGR